MAERALKWFPKPTELVEFIGYIHEQAARDNPDDKVAEWERDRQLHPEEYYTPEEIPRVMAEISKKLGLGG